MTRTPWIGDYLEEYEVDSEGHHIELIEGPKLTARSEAAERLWLQMIYRPERLEPLDQLPPELLVRHTRKKGWEDSPRYNFGWGISFQQLYDYAVKYRLMPKKYHGKFDWSLSMDLTNAEHEWMVARYSNYTWYEEVLKDRDEQAVIEIVQRELCIPDTPRWYRQLKAEPESFIVVNLSATTNVS